MNRHVQALALGTAAAVAACVVAVVVPGTALVGDLAMAIAELAAAVLIWLVGGHGPRRQRGWQLLAVALVVPVAWTLVALAVSGHDTVAYAYFSWAPTIPAFLLAMAASLTFLSRTQVRAGGSRLLVELVLFTTACLVGLQMLVLGPDGDWGSVTVGLRVTLAAAVLTMSASMAVGLTLLGAVEARRHDMALCLLAGSVLMSTGQALAASPALAGAAPAVGASRFFVVAGLAALAGAVLADPGPSAEAAERLRRATGSWAHFRQVAPHVAMALAMLVVVGASVTGHHPRASTLAGVACCVLLAAVHRWLTSREEEWVLGLLQRSEAYFRSLVRSSSDGVVIVGGDLRITWTSPALDWAQTPEGTPLAGHALADVVHPEDAATVAAALSRGSVDAATTDGSRAGLLLFRLRDAEGDWRYLEAGVSDVREDADVGALVLHCRDMTDRHEREQALQNIAFTDPMTGLPNRAGVIQLLSLRLSGTQAEPATLLMIAIDGLSAAREHVGRELVTSVVAEVGRRLRATVRGDDTVARMGGGAFAVLAHGTAGEADRLAARCLSVVEQPVLTSAGLLELTASVGLAPLDSGIDVDELLGHADLAVRAARASGEGCAARYTSALGEAATRQDRLRTDLQGAWARGEMFLLAQPIVSLVDERITGLEAQLHWRHPDLGEIAPAEFFALAERSGLLGELTRWALEEATTIAAGLPANGPPLRIGFTVPTGYATTGTLVADVERALTTSGLAPERLVLQVTSETATAGDDRTGLDITSLRLMGVHVALDGFGSGSSALAHLTQLPIDIVRIDRSLINRIDRDPQSRALCGSIAGIARALGIDVVAEGVETPAQLAALSGFGCDFAQGFLISRPISPSQVAALITEDAGSLLPGFVSRT